MGSALNMALPKVVLASASPARKRLLLAVGITPVVQVSDVDEAAAEAEFNWHTPAEIAAGLAALKAADVVKKQTDACIVIGCDSVMEFEGKAYGKPETAAIAIERLRQMSGKSGVLHTGHSVTLVTPDSRQTVHSTCSTEVHFHTLTEAEIAAYVITGEPLKVAGSFTIDSLGAPFIRAIQGDAANVEGLSVQTLRALFMKLGIGWETVLSQVTPE